MEENTQNKIIRYYQREVYGNVLLYPIDYPLELHKLTGKKTLDSNIMKALETMGFSFAEVTRAEAEQISTTK